MSSNVTSPRGDFSRVTNPLHPSTAVILEKSVLVPVATVTIYPLVLVALACPILGELDSRHENRVDMFSGGHTTP